jgi:vacuolar-type H+-ATPase subunit I/STV1
MKEELKANAENKQRQDKLKDLIDKAKQEGKDADSLERELKQLQDEAKQNAEAVEKLAQKLQKAAEAMKQGNMEDAADQLEQAGQAMKDIENDLKDLEDAEDYLQRLKEERKKACQNCKGGECPGDDDPEAKDDAEWTEFGQIGKGRRKENKDAQTQSYEERKKGLFDPKGRKSYGGSTRGPAFKKATAAELGPAIKEAAQEAPKATADPRFPRDAKEAVRDYFQNLGGQK